MAGYHYYDGVWEDPFGDRTKFALRNARMGERGGRLMGIV
jgi:hypothetical protein